MSTQIIWEKLLTLWSNKISNKTTKVWNNTTYEDENITDEDILFWQNFWASNKQTEGKAIEIKDINLKFYPASEVEIQKIEVKLGLTFPPSYRTFLQHVNGWPIGITENLLPVQYVDLFSKHCPMLFEQLLVDLEDDSLEDILKDFSKKGKVFSKENYFDYYGEAPPIIPKTYLETSIIIGIGETLGISSGDSISTWYGLNPQVVSDNGEWEAWCCSEYMDFMRYPSFADMVINAYLIHSQM